MAAAGPAGGSVTRGDGCRRQGTARKTAGKHELPVVAVITQRAPEARSVPAVARATRP
jgi:hypothetical protein